MSLTSCFAGYSQQAGVPKTTSSQSLEPTYESRDQILIEETDEDKVTTDVYSSVSFEYDHGSFSGGAHNDRFRIKGAQAFGPDHRMAFGYELPFIHGLGVDLGDGTPTPSGQGLGDIKVSLAGVLGKDPRFTHAAKVEFTFPSAPNDVVGSGQTIIRVEWGFSTPLSSKTTLDGIVGYNKAVYTRNGASGENSFEPEAVVAHTFTDRVAAYLDWDTYRDFNAEQWGHTLKAGFEFALDSKARWSASPYEQFPLNHFTRSSNLHSDAGLELAFRY